MRARTGIWVVVALSVVLATRTIVYALAPQSVLLAALAHNQVGPDVTVPLLVAVLVAAAVAAAVLGLAALAVRERLLLEGRRLVSRPQLRPVLLLVRAVLLFGATSFAFAMLESTIHWREGLGWHGLHCLTGPVHRDAIPVLAALSLIAVAIHGAIEHLLDWARRLFAELEATLLPGLRRPPALPPSVLRATSRRSLLNPARGPPAVLRPQLP
ncbi:MAG TPA: hypothetical protein VH063_03740 [Gaiellaceae bacterium]|jgi:hypothetical protein|nr:hypothetical protein [Gaiellaceae bacterium]